MPAGNPPAAPPAIFAMSISMRLLPLLIIMTNSMGPISSAFPDPERVITTLAWSD